MKNERRK